MRHLLRRLTIAEQAATHLRQGILAGHWSDKLPGAKALAADCDVSPVTMRAALRLLEQEGLITAGGEGRCRMVAGPDMNGRTKRSMRVAILLSEGKGKEDVGFQSFLYRLQSDLEMAGHVCSFAAKSLAELKHDPVRTSRFVARSAADAWLVTGGSKPILSWFGEADVPALAIGGRCMGLPIASTGLALMPAFRHAVRHLLALGHRRVVLLAPHYMRSPESDPIAMLHEELAAHGVTAGRYNVPEWEETPEGLKALLEQMFRYTPPTAIITTYTNWTVAVLSFLAHHEWRVPRDVSLLCINREDWFPWHSPSIAHLDGDENRMLPRIVRWVNAAARGRADREPIFPPMEFVMGESIGPAPRQRR